MKNSIVDANTWDICVVCFIPGTRYCYSNLGYLVLGRVIEVASGQSYEGYVRSLLAEIGITRMWLGKTHKAQSHSDEVSIQV